MVEGYHFGVNSYIQKPVDFDEFRNLDQAARLLLAGRQPAAPAAAFQE